MQETNTESLEKEIQQHLGQDSNHLINFRYDQRDGLTVLYLETINPRYNQMFLFHSETGVDKADALKKMLEYVRSYKDKVNSYTIQWAANGEKGVRTSYFDAGNIEEALDKFSYGRDRNKTTIFLISLNPKS
jgi:hypothetical protein